MKRAVKEYLKKAAACVLILAMLIPVIPLNSQAVYLLEDGRYSIPLRLWHASNNEASMGDAGVKKTGILVVKNGTATLQIELQSLNVAGFTGYLSELNTMKDIVFNSYQYPETYTKVPSTVLSVYDVVDSYNAATSTDENCRGVAYPKKVTIPVTLGEEFTWVQMYIPIMGAMGFGEQIARVKLDYDAITKLEPVSVTELQELLAEAEQFESSNYTSDSYAKLAEQMEAVKNLLAQDTAISEEIEEQYYALMDAIGALVANPVEDIPSTDTGTDKEDEEESSSLDKDHLKNGKYKVTVNLWKATSNKESMGNAAISNTALLEVKNGTYTMTIATHEMTVGTITACLASLQIQEKDGSYTYAKVTENKNPGGKPSAFQFIMPSKDEYIPVKIDPQVEIMGNEPLDARLKISWNTLKEVSSDTTISGGTQGNSSSTISKGVTLTDAVTGIQVTAEANVLENGVSLQVSQFTSGTTYKNAKRVLNDVAETFKLYQIQILNKSGKAVKPNGLVTISIPIPAFYNTSSLGTCRINSGGTMTKVSGSQANKMVSFSTRELGVYAVYEGVTSGSSSSNSSSSNLDVIGASSVAVNNPNAAVDEQESEGEDSGMFIDQVLEEQETAVLGDEKIEESSASSSSASLTTLDIMKLVVAGTVAISVTCIVLAVFAGITGYIIYKKLREESTT